MGGGTVPDPSGPEQSLRGGGALGRTGARDPLAPSLRGLVVLRHQGGATTFWYFPLIPASVPGF